MLRSSACVDYTKSARTRIIKSIGHGVGEQLPDNRTRGSTADVSGRTHTSFALVLIFGPKGPSTISGVQP